MDLDISILVENILQVVNLVTYHKYVMICTLTNHIAVAGAVTFLDTPCPPGRYCPQGTTHGDENLCPARTFYNVTGAKDLADCLPCTPGAYCEVDGLSMPTGLCDPGQLLPVALIFYFKSEIRLACLFSCILFHCDKYNPTCKNFETM